MNTLRSILSLLILIAILFASCKKDDHNYNPKPIEKKKYAWAVGKQDSTGYGMILFTPDAGKTWERQGVGAQALKGIDVNDVWPVSEKKVWAVGSNNSILYTGDGGETWKVVSAPDNFPDAGLSRISIIDDKNIWISGSYGTVYNSKDFGLSWTKIDTSNFSMHYLQGIHAIDNDRIFAVGSTSISNSRGVVYFTNDGGASWDSLQPAHNYNKWFWIGVIASGKTIVIYGGKSHYMVSTDNGDTWTNDSVNSGGINGADINDLIMFNENKWWGAFDMGQIFITEDGGNTWQEQDVPGVLSGNFMVGISAWDEKLALSVSFANSWPISCPTVMTDDGGNSWKIVDTVMSQMWKVSFVR